MRVRVCDDDETIADGWVEAIKAEAPSDAEIARLPNAKDEVSNLLLRKMAAEKGENPLAQECGFDGIDILAVDYDLIHLDGEGSRTTGEGIARLARTFSNCGVIVVMNQFKGPQFDLGMRGHLDSFAEINIDADLVGHAALWRDLEPADGQFDPTTWTPLPHQLDGARNLSAELQEKGFDMPLMAAIGLTESALSELSDTAFGFLSLEAETAGKLAEVTPRAFLARWLASDLVANLEAHAPTILNDFTAFRVAKWLDRSVLRPMDVLIDSAHLIDRLPFMIDTEKLNAADAGAWAKAARDPENSLRMDVLGQYRNENASKVLGRTVFDWYRLSGDDEIDKLQDAYLDNQPERFYLAEDTSRFVTKDAITRYRADFHNFGDRRGIERLVDITYGPMRRVTFA